MQNFSGRRLEVGPLRDLKPDLLVPEWVVAEIRISSLSNAEIRVRAEWSTASYQYEITELLITKGEGISTEDIRALSRPELLHATLDGLVKHDGELRWSRAQLKRFVEQGPTDETLTGISRLYAQVRAEGGQANRVLIASLGAPASTVNRWLAAARAKGLLDG